MVTEPRNVKGQSVILMGLIENCINVLQNNSPYTRVSESKISGVHHVGAGYTLLYGDINEMHIFTV